MTQDYNDGKDADSNRIRSNSLKKYSKMARASMLALTMGMTMSPALSAAAHDTNPAEPASQLAAAGSPVQYTGNSLAYFQNVFLPQSSFLAPAEGEDAPVALNVTIGGTTMVGYTLTGSYMFQDANGDAENGSTYQWYRSDDAEQQVNFTPIPDATGITYILTAEDVGKYITFEVTPKTDVAPTDGIPTKSAATAQVVNVPADTDDDDEESPSVDAPTPPVEESLLEVVALKKNEETQDSAKLMLTKDGDAVSVAAFQFISEGVIQSSEQAANKETIAVRAQSLTGAEKVQASIDGNAISSLKTKEQKLSVITGDVAIEFPTASIPLEELAASSGTPADQIKLEITIEKQPESVKQLIQEWADEQQAQVIGEAYQFSLQANTGTDSTSIVQYGNRYAYFTVPIPAGIDHVDSLGAVMLVDGKYVPVPVRILDSGHALIHTPTNATVMLIQRNANIPDASRHWSNEALHLMANKGNITGDAQGNVNPDEKITRSEFADLLVKSLGLGHQDYAGKGPEFSDLPEDAQLRESIRIAAASGLFQGVSEGTFAPEKSITREEIIAVLIRFFQEYELEAGTTAAANGLPSFQDHSAISDWALQDLETAARLGIVSGYENGTIRPTDEGTRAEAAALIRRFMSATGLTN